MIKTPEIWARYTKSWHWNVTSKSQLQPFVKTTMSKLDVFRKSAFNRRAFENPAPAR